MEVDVEISGLEASPLPHTGQPWVCLRTRREGDAEDLIHKTDTLTNTTEAHRHQITQPTDEMRTVMHIHIRHKRGDISHPPFQNIRHRMKH